MSKRVHFSPWSAGATKGTPSATQNTSRKSSRDKIRK